MKKSDLPLRALNRIKIPPADPVARERALERALVALRNRTDPQVITDSTGRLWPRLFAFSSTALAIVLFVFWIDTPKGLDGTKVADLQLLNQLAALFPDKLEAVVEQNGEVELQLAAGEVAPSQQPLMLILRRGREMLRVLSYSGQEVCLELNGRRTCLELLAQDNGDVIVAGKDFLWSQQHPLALDGYQIEANLLVSPL